MEVSKVVPQFFYDLIARGVPGGALLIGLAIATGNTANLAEKTMLGIPLGKESATSYFIFLILFFLYSYILGHIIEPIGDCMRQSNWLKRLFPEQTDVIKHSLSLKTSRYATGIRKQMIDELDSVVRHEMQAQAGITDDEQEFIQKEGPKFEYIYMIYLWAEWLRCKNPDAGARIVKLRAECRMLIGLCVVGAITFIVHLFYALLNKNVALNSIILLISLFVFMLCLAGFAEIYKIFQHGVINGYLITKSVEAEQREYERKKQTNTGGSG